MINETALATIFNQKTFGMRFSASVVGGRGRLHRLIMDGAIRATKRSNSPNGKLYCNAWDVIKHAHSKYLDDDLILKGN